MRAPHLSSAILIAAAVTVAGAQPPPPQPVTPIPFTGPARIKLDLDRTIGQVDPLLFGNFAEHVGRMIFVNVLNRSKDKDITASIAGLAGVAPGAPRTGSSRFPRTRSRF